MLAPRRGGKTFPAGCVNSIETGDHRRTISEGCGNGITTWNGWGILHAGGRSGLMR